MELYLLKRNCRFCISIGPKAMQCGGPVAYGTGQPVTRLSDHSIAPRTTGVASSRARLS